MTKRRKYEEIAEHLELTIVSGRLSVGDRIPSERDLMDQFEAGRSSVREAIFALQRKGLLSASPGAAARVIEPTATMMVEELSGVARLFLARPDGVRELQAARMLFEVGVARQAARTADTTSIDTIREALEANEAASDGDAFVATDIAFHSAIARSCGNSAYMAVGAAFSDWLRGQRVVSADAGATRADVAAHHRAIYEAIATRDHVAAEDAMERHLTTVARQYWQGLA